MMNETHSFLSFLDNCKTPFHVIQESERQLCNAGFSKLDLTQPWELHHGQAYYTIAYDTALFAFKIGTDTSLPATHMIAAHTDQPCLKVKPNPELRNDSYLKLNVGVYGSPILNTWLDRPLSIAGKITYQDPASRIPQTKLIDYHRPLLTIPNVSLHLERTMNKGIELNKQTDLSPLLSIVESTLSKDESLFLSDLCDLAEIDRLALLDFDLSLYNAEPACLLGLQNEFISSARLDNLSSVFACLTAIQESTCKQGIQMIALFDHEEIGSRSKQGANSSLATIVLEKIYDYLGFSRRQYLQAIFQSFLLSGDVAHCLQPNKPEKTDPTHICTLHHGVALKLDYNQCYAFDSEAVAFIQHLCLQNQIPMQKFINRSDLANGHTLGPLLSAQIPMRTVDVGVPLLAMHSARELISKKDQLSLQRLFCIFFQALDHTTVTR